MKKNTRKYNQPLVSVVMPVYNAGDFLMPAIESILNQTYRNIEFLIVDDASSDKSWSILKRYALKDKRIKILRNKKNEGVSVTVKRAIEIARGDYLARMDADDIALANRLQKQVEYLQKHTKTVAIGGQCYTIDSKDNVIGEKKFPTDFTSIYRYIFTFVPLQQPTLMIAKKRLPDDFEYYHDSMDTAEEIELLFKLFKYGKVENLKDHLLMYRIHDHNTSFKNIRSTFYLTLISRIKACATYGYKPYARDILISLMQLMIVTILPQRVTLWLYQKIRHMIARKLTINLPSKVSPQLLASYK